MTRFADQIIDQGAADHLEVPDHLLVVLMSDLGGKNIDLAFRDIFLNTVFAPAHDGKNRLRIRAFEIRPFFNFANGSKPTAIGINPLFTYIYDILGTWRGVMDNQAKYGPLGDDWRLAAKLSAVPLNNRTVVWSLQFKPHPASVLVFALESERTPLLVQGIDHAA